MKHNTRICRVDIDGDASVALEDSLYDTADIVGESGVAGLVGMAVDAVADEIESKLLAGEEVALTVRITKLDDKA